MKWFKEVQDGNCGGEGIKGIGSVIDRVAGQGGCALAPAQPQGEAFKTFSNPRVEVYGLVERAPPLHLSKSIGGITSSLLYLCGRSVYPS